MLRIKLQLFNKHKRNSIIVVDSTNDLTDFRRYNNGRFYDVTKQIIITPIIDVTSVFWSIALPRIMLQCNSKEVLHPSFDFNKKTIYQRKTLSTRKVFQLFTQR